MEYSRAPLVLGAIREALASLEEDSRRNRITDQGVRLGPISAREAAEGRLNSKTAPALVDHLSALHIIKARIPACIGAAMMRERAAIA